MENNEREALEAYRKERKERIAKQAKSNSKKSHGYSNSKVVDKAISIVISVVLVLAIVFGIVSFAGIPQRLLNAIVIDGERYSMAELSCYYMQQYLQIYNTAASYDEQYGEGYGKMFVGYDTTLLPTDQTTTDDDGNVVTWDEQFMNDAIEQMASIKRYYTLAKEAKIELDDDANSEIEQTITSLKTSAGDYSLNAMLEKQYGKGVNEKLFRKVLEEQQMVSLYQEAKQNEYRKNYTAEQIDAEYEKDKTKYDTVGFRWFTIDVDTAAEKEELTTGGEDTTSEAVEVYAEEIEAQRFIDKVKAQSNYNEETFKQVVLEFAEEEDLETYEKDASTKLEKISKETIESNVSADAANWLFETKDGNYVRQVGDMKYFLSSDSSTVYIIYAIGTPYKDTDKPVSVRHILVQFPETTTAENSEPVSGEIETTAVVSEDVKAECESEAVSILNDYKDYIKTNTSGKADEDYFIELVSKYSDDTGSSSSGGLIENMENNGSYVTEFEDWAFSEGNFEGEKREPGTTAIIETEYGYHVMYFVEEAENPVWYETILTEFVEADWKAEQERFEALYGEDAIKRRAFLEKSVKKSCLKIIERNFSA